jgi:preprotein translocase subunit SecE
MKALMMLNNTNKFDAFKWAAAVILLALLVAGNAYYGNTIALTIRVTIMLVVGIIALLIILTTVKGQLAWQFIKEARVELRKVVWPNKQETLQTTAMIAVLVVITALILWGIDSLYAYIISSMIA